MLADSVHFESVRIVCAPLLQTTALIAETSTFGGRRNGPTPMSDVRRPDADHADSSEKL